jgi:hypothetical protein
MTVSGFVRDETHSITRSRSDGYKAVLGGALGDGSRTTVHQCQIAMGGPGILAQLNKKRGICPRCSPVARLLACLRKLLSTKSAGHLRRRMAGIR